MPDLISLMFASYSFKYIFIIDSNLLKIIYNKSHVSLNEFFNFVHLINFN